MEKRHDDDQITTENVDASRAPSSAWSPGQPTSDGAGVKLTRVLTQPLQRRLDPFLMLDAFGTDESAGLHRRLSRTIRTAASRPSRT